MMDDQKLTQNLIKKAAIFIPVTADAPQKKEAGLIKLIIHKFNRIRL
jgi:hypothetical protein